MARLTADREALLSEEERRRLFRSMMLSRLCVITLVFCILCWIICATIGPIAFLDQRPVAFWLIPAGIFAINYYAYAIFTEFSDDSDVDRWWRVVSAVLICSPLVVYFTIAGMMFLFFTVSEVELATLTRELWLL